METTGRREDRIEPALEVPPRPTGAVLVPLEAPPRPTPGAEAVARGGRSRWRALRWIVLVVFFALAILAGIVVARGA